jgi:hypothetical protein
MNTPQTPPLLHERRSRFLCFTIPLTAILFLVALNVASFFLPGAETRILSRAIMREDSASWIQRLSLQPGFVSLSVVRLVLHFVPVPPEARSIAGAIKSAGVTIYRREPGAGGNISTHASEYADNEMRRAGWLRTVFVKSREGLVVVYTHQTPTLFGNMKCCAAIQKNNELVLVQATTDLGTIIELATKHLDHSKRHRPSRSTSRPPPPEA